MRFSRIRLSALVVFGGVIAYNGWSCLFVVWVVMAVVIGMIERSEWRERQAAQDEETGRHGRGLGQ